MVKENGNFAFNFPYTDHLESILTVTNASGAVIAEQNFDAWGRRRNPNVWDYNNVTQWGVNNAGTIPDWLYRGFTGHEHLPEFGLINMNARLYDPVLGRMLSVDNHTGVGTQGLNRYSYATNNPLNRIDPSGNDPIYFNYSLSGNVITGHYDFSNGNYAIQGFSGVAGGTYGTFSLFGNINANPTTNTVSISQTAKWNTYAYTSDNSRIATYSQWSTDASIYINLMGPTPAPIYSNSDISYSSLQVRENFDYYFNAPNPNKSESIGGNIARPGEKIWNAVETLYSIKGSLDGNVSGDKFYGLNEQLRKYGKQIVENGWNNFDLGTAQKDAGSVGSFLGEAAFWSSKIASFASKTIPYLNTLSSILDGASYVVPKMSDSFINKLDNLEYRYNKFYELVKPIQPVYKIPQIAPTRRY